MSFDRLKKVRLGDVAEIQTGPFGSQLHQRDYRDTGTPIITVEHLGQNRIIHGNFPRVSNEDKKRLKKFILREGDIVFSRVGSVDRRAFVNKEQEGWLFSGRCLRVRVFDKQINPLYLSYYFGLENFKEYIRRVAVGATMPSLNTKIMSDIEIMVPEKNKQDCVANILSSLDDKIELNNRINKTLENIAQAIFKHWFVDFEFPDENGEPYKSSGGEMVDSEIGPIPHGWRVGCLGEIAHNIRIAVTPESIAPETPYIGLEHIPRKSIALSNWDENTELMSNKYEFQEGDILFGKLRPYFHKVGMAMVSGICSTDILVINTKIPNWYAFILCHLFSDDFISYANAVSTGTKMPRTNWSDMANYRLALPPVELAGEFNRLLRSLLLQIKKNVIEARCLLNLRDTLLPRLMSGEIRVPMEEVIIGV